MPQRNLLIEGHRHRLLPTHSLFDHLVDNLFMAGVRCHCCPGFWRWERNPILAAKLNVRRRRLDWLFKRYPGRMRQLGDQERRRLARTGLENDHWWEQILDSYGTFT
jgi:hypothetical protein